MYMLTKNSNPYAILDLLDPLLLFKSCSCILDLAGIKSCSCIVHETCLREQRWFQKKSNFKPGLRKVQGIDVVLPRGLKIEKDKQLQAAKVTKVVHEPQGKIQTKLSSIHEEA